MTKRESPKPGIYQHFKGKQYQVTAVGKHSETLEEMVIYKAMYDNPVSKYWVRPKKMFLETVMVDGKEVPRFALFKK